MLPGTLKWKYQTGGGVWATPAFGSDNTIFVASTDHKLYAIYADGNIMS